MKKIITAVMALCLIAGVAMAQEQGERPQRPNKDQVTKMKVNKLVKNLALDNKTAELFTATYTQYQEDVAKINEKYPPMNFPGIGPDNEKGRKGKAKGEAIEMPLDEEVEKSILDGFARERELLNIKEKYYRIFCKFLTPQQIQKMYQLENAPRGMQNSNRQMPPQGGRPGGFPGGGPGMGGMMHPGGM